MNDDSEDLNARIDKLSSIVPISPERFEEILKYAGVSAECDKCKYKSWHYLTTDSDHEVMNVTYLLSGRGNTKQDTLSYFTRACLRCGNMQNYARVILKATEERMMKEGE